MTVEPLTLGYPPAAVISVRSVDPSVLAWLREFLVPDFDEPATGEVTHAIALSEEAVSRAALLRAARHAAESHIDEHGGLVVHGAAIAVGGRGYVIAGPKEAGKTTLLVHLLRTNEASYISNDRVAVRVSGPGATVRGMPTIVRVRPTTLAWFDGLAERFRRSGFHHRLTLDEAARRPDPPLDDGSFDLTPAQFAHVLGVRRSGEVPLAGIILPRRSESTDPLTLQPIDAASAAQRLRDTLIAGDASRVTGLCERVPVFTCELGPMVYRSPSPLAL